MDLVTFVRARLDERTALAGFADDAAGLDWEAGSPTGPWSVSSNELPAGELVATGLLEECSDFVAANDPDYVLRDIAAKRAIVDELERNPALVGDPKDPLHNMAHAHWVQAVRHLAAIDQDHPDYQQEWKLP